jgi:multiple sugar transport system substrate-binding protein
LDSVAPSNPSIVLNKGDNFAYDPNVTVSLTATPRKSVVEAGKDIYSVGLRKVFTDEICNSAIPEPRFPTEVVDAVGDAMQNVMFKKMSGADAAKEADAKISAALKK